LHLEANQGSVTGHFTVAASTGKWQGPREGPITGTYTEFGSIQLHAQYAGVTASFLGTFAAPDENLGTMYGIVTLTSDGKPRAQGTLSATFLPGIDRFLSIVW
jgi:hypothetical protein